MELFAGVIVVGWLLLYYVEVSARKKAFLGKFAWLARSLKQLVFGVGIGAVLIIHGTEWKLPLYEVTFGGLLVLWGVVMGVRTIIKRKTIQTDLESGKIKPIAQEG